MNHRNLRVGTLLALLCPVGLYPLGYFLALLCTHRFHDEHCVRALACCYSAATTLAS